MNNFYIITAQYRKELMNNVLLFGFEISQDKSLAAISPALTVRGIPSPRTGEHHRGERTYRRLSIRHLCKEDRLRPVTGLKPCGLWT